MSQTVTRLLAFARCIREGSFSRAAAQSGVTQSAISQQVAKLETEMGAPLIVRDREGLRLTRTGQEVYELSEQILTLAQAFEERREGIARLKGGHLKIIANSPRPALGSIGAFKALHPGVEIEFGLYDWTSATRLVRERQCDVAILTEPKGVGACLIEEIERVAYVAYLPINHPLAAQTTLSLRDLCQETVLLPEEGSFTRRIVAEKLSLLGTSFPYVIRTTTFPLMQEAVLHEVGIGIFLDRASHESTSLAVRPIIEMPETYATCVVHARDKANLRLIRAFVDVSRNR